ncbi:MAG: ribosomal protein S19 family protein, partial [Ferruginibacter sp.]|nr:ribosomal protein S19 family protein [Ferruginibacter sp.]
MLVVAKNLFFSSTSIKKGPFIDQYLLDKIKNLPAGGRTIIKTWSRRSTV